MAKPSFTTFTFPPLVFLEFNGQGRTPPCGSGILQANYEILFKFFVLFFSSQSHGACHYKKKKIKREGDYMANRLVFFAISMVFMIKSWDVACGDNHQNLSHRFLSIFSSGLSEKFRVVYTSNRELHKIASITSFYLTMNNTRKNRILVFPSGRRYIQKNGNQLLAFRHFEAVAGSWLYKTVNMTVPCCSRTCNYRAFEREYMTLSAKTFFREILNG